MGNTLAMKLLRSLFRLSDSRFAFSINVHELGQMLNELKKELQFRFLMSYLIAWGVLGILMWYFITFTQLYGWQVSVFWLLTGFIGCLMRFVVYDLLICKIYSALARSKK
jgi:hypothetical protein